MLISIGSVDIPPVGFCKQINLGLTQGEISLILLASPIQYIQYHALLLDVDTVFPCPPDSPGARGERPQPQRFSEVLCKFVASH